MNQQHGTAIRQPEEKTMTLPKIASRDGWRVSGEEHRDRSHVAIMEGVSDIQIS